MSIKVLYGVIAVLLFACLGQAYYIHSGKSSAPAPARADWPERTEKLQQDVRQKLQKGEALQPALFDDFFDDEFFGRRFNPFAEMERMHRQMAGMFGVSPTRVSRWTCAYERCGIAGLEAAPAGRTRKLSAKVEAAEQIVKAVVKAEPDAGISKVQGALYRRGFLSMARETVRRLLRRNGVGPQEVRLKRRNKPVRVKNFERACPNDLWQTDIITFMLKGQYRVYLIGFMDDNSRFMVGWGLYRFQTADNVQEVFRAAIEKRGMPKEVLSDNGRQYHSWRGRSKFTTMLTKLGIRHIRSRPYHPQTCGKIESFWRNLYQECLTKMPLATFEEAQSKIGEYIEYYNFKRPHQGIGNLIPSDRYYGVAGVVKQIIAGEHGGGAGGPAYRGRIYAADVPGGQYRREGTAAGGERR